MIRIVGDNLGINEILGFSTGEKNQKAEQQAQTD